MNNTLVRTSNNRKAKIAKFSFSILGAIILVQLLSLLIDFLFDKSSTPFNILLNNCVLVSFLFSGISYLIWYIGINRNFGIYEISKGKKKSRDDFLIWLIPFFNAIIPYFRLRKIYSDYRGPKKFKHSSFKIFLNTWCIAFWYWYIAFIFIVMDLPISGEDIDIFYAKYPERELIHELSGYIPQLIGLICMIMIITILTQTENEKLKNYSP